MAVLFNRSYQHQLCFIVLSETSPVINMVSCHQAASGAMDSEQPVAALPGDGGLMPHVVDRGLGSNTDFSSSQAGTVTDVTNACVSAVPVVFTR